jgi:hypothetical protein
VQLTWTRKNQEPIRHEIWSMKTLTPGNSHVQTRMIAFLLIMKIQVAMMAFWIVPREMWLWTMTPLRHPEGSSQRLRLLCQMGWVLRMIILMC